MKTTLTTSVLLIGAVTVTSAAFATGGSDMMMSGHNMMTGSMQNNMHADTGSMRMSGSMMNATGSMMNGNMGNMMKGMPEKKLTEKETSYVQERLKSIGKNQSRLDTIVAKIDRLLSGTTKDSVKQKLQEIKDLIIEFQAK